MDLHSYASAGVDIARAESFVERLKQRARRAGHDNLWKGAGGYACVVPVSGDQAVALTTDGVGTKLLVACQLNRHDTIGTDLVAMCANDLICVGARPTAFLDYYAVGSLSDEQADCVIQGIIAGCDLAGMILAGGETAEMPGLYGEGHYDLAGFAIGQVSRDGLITGEAIKAGQKLIGVASSGIHSNGLSLARKILAGDRRRLEELLTPTLIYVRPVLSLLEEKDSCVTGIAHITGGGWRNLFRLNGTVGYHIDNPLPVPDIFRQLSACVEEAEMYRTFNMGMGLCLITAGEAGRVVDAFRSHGFAAQQVGLVTDRAKTLTMKDSAVILGD